MPRDFRVHLEDILGAIGKIKRYTKGLSKQGFAGDDKTEEAGVDAAHVDRCWCR